MSLTQKIRKRLIDISGYWIYKKIHLPIGTDLKEDLIYKFNVNPKVIFDIGAHYGETALYYRDEFPLAKVYSFEPVKKSFDKLLKNVNGKNISCYHTAMGDRQAEIEIQLYDEYYSPMNSLKGGNQNTGGQKEKVTVTTVDIFVKENSIGNIDLLKIDTEGYEIEVLKGAENILTKGNVGAIFAEVALSPTNKRNTQLSDVVNYLDGFGYYLVGLYDIDARTYKQGITYANALFINKNHETGNKYTL